MGIDSKYHFDHERKIYMIKKHDVMQFISSSIEDSVNRNVIPIVETKYDDNNNLIVIFTELTNDKELVETKYKITVELL